MPIRNRDLRTLMLRASPIMFAGEAVRALAQHDNPAEWLLIYAQSGGYVVLRLADLAARLPTDPTLLSRSLEDARNEQLVSGVGHRVVSPGGAGELVYAGPRIAPDTRVALSRLDKAIRVSGA